MAADSALTVEYLTSSRIGEKGQLTVPKQYRDEVGLPVGAPVAVLRIGSGLLLIPEQARFLRLCDSIASTLRSRGITAEALQATLPETRRRLFARRYPGMTSGRLAGRTNQRRGR